MLDINIAIATDIVVVIAKNNPMKLQALQALQYSNMAVDHSPPFPIFKEDFCHGKPWKTRIQFMDFMEMMMEMMTPKILRVLNKNGNLSNTNRVES